MREKTTINTKSIAITAIDVNDKIANGEKFPTESSASLPDKTSNKVNKFSVLLLLVIIYLTIL